MIINNFQAAYDATNHLIQQGCRRIAHITSSLKRNVYSERLRGYRHALQENDLKYDEKLLIIDGFKEEDATRSAKRILAMKTLPDGIFITNDFCAAVVMQLLKDEGLRIPEDIAIVGFNNDSIGKAVNPKLTTINYPGFEMGQVAASSLINHYSKNGTSFIAYFFMSFFIDLYTNSRLFRKRNKAIFYPFAIILYNLFKHRICMEIRLPFEN